MIHVHGLQTTQPSLNRLRAVSVYAATTAMATAPSLAQFFQKETSKANNFVLATVTKKTILNLVMNRTNIL